MLVKGAPHRSKTKSCAYLWDIVCFSCCVATLSGKPYDSGRATKLPQSISGLPHLNHIHLESYNNVCALPEDIGGCAKLSHLKLLPESWISELPKSLTQCKQLEVLETPQCLLKQLPDDIGTLRKLRELNLHQCPIAVLPESLGELQFLTILKITGDQGLLLPMHLRHL